MSDGSYKLFVATLTKRKHKGIYFKTLKYTSCRTTCFCRFLKVQNSLFRLWKKYS